MNLSNVYDEILADPKFSKLFYRQLKPLLNEPILECACGSGDLLIEIQKDFYATGLDLDQQMLELAKKKGAKNLVLGDMLDLSPFKNLNTVLCVGDSLNYLIEKESVEKFFNEVYSSLNPGGRFIFDMHTINRLQEFKEPFIEEANMGDYQYQWSIISEQDIISHQFIFYINDDTIKQNILQRVYQVELIVELLNLAGFKQIETSIDQDQEKVLVMTKKEAL